MSGAPSPACVRPEALIEPIVAAIHDDEPCLHEGVVHAAGRVGNNDRCTISAMVAAFALAATSYVYSGHRVAIPTRGVQYMHVSIPAASSPQRTSAAPTSPLFRPCVTRVVRDH